MSARRAVSLTLYVPSVALVAVAVWMLRQPKAPDDAIVEAIETGNADLLWGSLFAEERTETGLTKQGFQLLFDEIICPWADEWEVLGRGRRSYFLGGSHVITPYYLRRKDSGATATFMLSLYCEDGRPSYSVIVLVTAAWNIGASTVASTDAQPDLNRMGLDRDAEALRASGIVGYYDPTGDRIVKFPYKQ